MEERKSAASTASLMAILMTVGLSLIALVITGLLSMKIIKSILTPIYDMVGKVSGISESLDLTERMSEEGEDELAELGQSFNKLIVSFERNGQAG